MDCVGQGSMGGRIRLVKCAVQSTKFDLNEQCDGFVVRLGRTPHHDTLRVVKDVYTGVYAANVCTVSGEFCHH